MAAFAQSGMSLNRAASGPVTGEANFPPACTVYGNFLEDRRICLASHEAVHQDCANQGAEFLPLYIRDRRTVNGCFYRFIEDDCKHGQIVGSVAIN